MKLNKNSRTDRDTSLAAEEFVWDDASPSEANFFILPSVERLLKFSRATKVLDLGCGNGYVSGYLSKLGYDVTGCDYSKTGIDLAKKQHPDVHFFLQDLSRPLPAEHLLGYDAVISTEVIEHLLLPRKLIENALSALKPNGTLIVSTPYHGYVKNLALALTNSFDRHWHPLRDYGHVKFFSKQTLIQLLKESQLTDICFETVGRIPLLARSMIVSGVKV